MLKSTNTQVTTAIAFSSNGYIAAPSGPLATASGAVSTSPKISNVQVTDSSYVVLDDTAANSGGYVSINGSNFDSGATYLVFPCNNKTLLTQQLSKYLPVRTY